MQTQHGRAKVALALLAAFAGSTASKSVPPSNDAHQQQGSPVARFAFGGNAAEIPADFLDHLVLLPVSVNDSQPSLLVLDSITPTSVIDAARAAELGLPITPAAAEGAPRRDDVILNPTLRLPGVELPFSSLPVMSRTGFGEATGRPYLGTLGSDFLSRVVVEIDYLRQTVRLYDPSVYKYSGHGMSVPLTFAGVPVVKARFNGAHGKEEADFVLETALDDPVIFSESYADAHRMIGSHSATTPAYRAEWSDSPRNVMARLKAFQMAKYTATDVLAVFTQKRSILSKNDKIAGAIGGGFLRRFTAVFDFAHQQLFLEPNSHFGDFEEADMSGLSVVARGANLKTFEIVDVAHGSPAALAGIQNGEVIEAIDDEPAADLSLVSIRNLFCQIGHKYKLLLEHGGQTREVEIRMKRLI